MLWLSTIDGGAPKVLCGAPSTVRLTLRDIAGALWGGVACPCGREIFSFHDELRNGNPDQERHDRTT